MHGDQSPVEATLAESLGFVLGYAPKMLVPEAAGGRLLSLARHLPPNVRGLLECRFDGQSHVDLSIGVLDKTIERRALRDSLAGFDDGLKAWVRVTAFLERWSRSDAPETDRYAWFEFDLDKPELPPKAPSVFLSVGQLGMAHGWENELACLSDTAVPLTAQWLNRVPEGAVADFIGVMVPRGPEGIRLNLAGLAPQAAWPWLQENGARLPGSAERVFRQLYEVNDVVLTVDAGAHSLGQRVGLECRPKSEAGVKALFDLCVAHGLCDAEVSRAAMDWRGNNSPLDGDPAFPLHLLLEGLTNDTGEPTVLVREINHLKATFTSRGLEDAKIYLSFTKLQRRNDADGKTKGFD